VILLPESWRTHRICRPLGYLAAALAALSAYLAAQHGCALAEEATGGANYTPLALSILAYAFAALVVTSSPHYSRLVRTIALVTLPLAVFLVPAFAVGVVQDIGNRICAAKE
jgi:predicted membrane-bound dolichyl-phosphate-mannose-protein mannosyltransferase